MEVPYVSVLRSIAWRHCPDELVPSRENADGTWSGPKCPPVPTFLVQRAKISVLGVTGRDGRALHQKYCAVALGISKIQSGCSICHQLQATFAFRCKKIKAGLYVGRQEVGS